jgi:hypothetical protein
MPLGTFSLIMLAACVVGCLLGARVFTGNSAGRPAAVVALMFVLMAGLSSVLAESIRPEGHIIAGFWTLFALSTGIFIGQCVKAPESETK